MTREIGLKCPFCQRPVRGGVINTRKVPFGVRRRRECECGERFSTMERRIDIKKEKQPPDEGAPLSSELKEPSRRGFGGEPQPCRRAHVEPNPHVEPARDPEHAPPPSDSEEKPEGRSINGWKPTPGALRLWLNIGWTAEDLAEKYNLDIEDVKAVRR